MNAPADLPGDIPAESLTDWRAPMARRPADAGAFEGWARGLLQRFELRPPYPGAPFPSPAALITLRPAAVEVELVPRR